MSRDQTQTERTDYSFLQFMGDASAVYGALHAVGHVLLFTFLRADVVLDTHLLNAIFRKRPDRSNPLKTSLVKTTFKEWLLASLCSWGLW